MATEWREFERDCAKLLRWCFPNDEYRVEEQHERIYRQDVRKRMDIHIAERRQGGCHYVIDCKHWPIARLNEGEIQTTLEYKRLSGASKAIILISESSNCPKTFIESAKRQGVPVIRVRRAASNAWFVSVRQHINDFFFYQEMRRHIS